MNNEPCYKEDSLRDFATWAAKSGHYTVAPLLEHYREYLKNVKDRGSEPLAPPEYDD